MISAHDVLNARFMPTKFREGYEMAEVDQFLDQIARTLGRLEAGYTSDADGGRLVAPDDVRNKQFVATKFRGGYDVDQVDDFLDKVQVTLTEYVARATRGELTPRADEAVSPQETPAQAAPSVAEPAVETSATETPSTPAPHAPSPDAMRAGDFLREIQYARATSFGAARESLTVHAPDGSTFSVVGVEKTESGLVIRIG